MVSIRTTSSSISPNCIRINNKIISINRNPTIFHNLGCIIILILPKNLLLITRLRSTRGTTILAILTMVITRCFIVIEHHPRITLKRYHPTAMGISLCPIACLRRGRCQAGGRCGSRGSPILWIKSSRGLPCILWTSSLQGWSRLSVWRPFPSNWRRSYRTSTTGWSSSEPIWLELWARIWEVWSRSCCRWYSKLSRNQKGRWGNICRCNSKNWGLTCWG